MRLLFQISAILSLSCLCSCVGTDLIDDPIIGERLAIQPRVDSLAVGQLQVFSVKYSNKYGIDETAKNLRWSSSDTSKIKIDATGKVQIVALGKTTIFASNSTVLDSIVLNKNVLVVNNPTKNDTTFLKKGVLQAVSGSYSIKGTIQVQTVKGVTTVVTDAGFSVSAGPSLYVLLTNHTDGRYTVTPGANAVNIVSAQITANKLSSFSGALSWTVPQSVNPADYKYVVFYCALGPVFGTAELR